MRRRWSGLAAIAAAAVLLVTVRSATPPPPVPVIDPSLASRMEIGMTVCPQPVAAVVPAPVKHVAQARLPEAPKPAPIVTRTVFTAAKPASLTSTPIPSGAARLVTVSRVSGSVRVAIDPVAGGLVTSVRAFSNPPRLIIDVSGIPPVSEHEITVKDPELGRIMVTKQGKATRLTVNLTRQPARVVQQGDSALISY